MQNFYKLYFIWQSVILLLIAKVDGFRRQRIADLPFSNNVAYIEESKNERYYMVFIKSSLGVEKRQELSFPVVNTTEFINGKVDEIHSLILNNKDTYVNTENFEALKTNILIKRRDDDSSIPTALENTVRSPYVFPISSVEDSTVLYAYLSKDLVKKVEELSYVSSVRIGEQINIDVMENGNYDRKVVKQEIKWDDVMMEEDDDYNRKVVKREMEWNNAVKEEEEEEEEGEEHYYKIRTIQRETGWKNVTVREDTYMHLSLISQGIVNHDIIGSFDYNYYYPSSAGEDIDIILIDTGFNFENEEFSNHGKERQVRCVAEIQNAILSESLEESRCGLHREASYHGEIVADIVGGLESGVANKANIYGIAVHSKEGKFLEEDMFLALQYIIDTLIRPHKTVINLSSGIYYPISEPGDNYHHYQLLIRRLVEKGATVIASAGNDGALTYNRKHNFQYCPCSFYGVICVGGIKDIHPIFSNHYEVDAYSNSGETVNIYAPFYVYGSYQDEKGRDHDDYFYGTSFSAPIVAGVAATIMGEFKAIKFDSYSMNDFLIRLGEKNRITNLDPGRNNVFLNNGKSMVYSSDGMYYGCGYHSGHHTCSNPKSTCSEEGYCINENGEIELEKSNPIIKDDFPDFDFDFDFPFLSYYSTTDDQATEFPEWYDESDEKNEERITTDPFFFEPEDEEEIFNENDKTFSVTLIDDPLLIPEPTDDINEGIGLD